MSLPDNREPRRLPRQPLNQRFWAAVQIAVVVFGLYSIWIWFRPKVDVNLDKTLDRTDPFATRFALVNGSPLSIRDVRFVCLTSMSATIRNNRTQAEVPAKQVAAGATLVRTCGILAPNFPLNTILDTEVTYAYPILGTRHETMHFASQKDAQGVPQWFKTVQRKKPT
jgi:hypothetical protein